MFRSSCLLFLIVLCGGSRLLAADVPPMLPPAVGDRMITDYFQKETFRIRDACLADVNSLDDWNAKKGEYRRQLFDMLGLDPLPAKTEMLPVVTGRIDHPEFTVENIQFQSRPGLYVTGNLYLPKDCPKPVPAILYVCGHAAVKKGDISFGSKAHYQFHGEWFARNGYACLTIDTLQLGEIEGIHHGTYRFNRWWWLSRGYTPAGVEAWNCIRALDYLQSRPEVDSAKLGVTGRSGGGAYSWWIAALDERIKAAVPVAGITDLENHVVDGTVEGHCDCMFMNNYYQWDYPLVAALVAPRPLLISNTDRDGIFPLNGVYRLYTKVRNLYELHKAGDQVALNITAGGHNDTQELQVHAFRWFDQHLKGEKRLLEKVARPYFEPEQLRVFKELPANQINTKVDELFIPVAQTAAAVTSQADWDVQARHWKAQLLEKSFRGWPAEPAAFEKQTSLNVQDQGISFQAIDFTSQTGIRLTLYLVKRAGLEKPTLVVLNTLDETGWIEFQQTYQLQSIAGMPPQVNLAGDGESLVQTRKMLQAFPWVMAYVAPRGIGLTAWDQSEKKQTQHRRRFYLLGQTLEGMQAWDVRRAMQMIREETSLKEVPLWIQSQRNMAAISVYAALFEPPVKRLDLHSLPVSHQTGPAILNVRKFMDLPQALALAASQSQVIVYDAEPDAWKYVSDTAQNLNWNAKQFQLRSTMTVPK